MNIYLLKRHKKSIIYLSGVPLQYFRVPKHSCATDPQSCHPTLPGDERSGGQSIRMSVMIGGSPRNVQPAAGCSRNSCSGWV